MTAPTGKVDKCSFPGRRPNYSGAHPRHVVFALRDFPGPRAPFLVRTTCRTDNGRVAPRQAPQLMRKEHHGHRTTDAVDVIIGAGRAAPVSRSQHPGADLRP